MEGIFDFCLGCWIFGQAISLGFLSPSVYRPYLNLLDDKKWGYTYNNTKRNLPNAKNEHVLLPGQDYETPVDLIRKDRLETEYKQEDFDLIKHAKVDFFAVPMGIAALAFAFKGGDDTVAGAKLGTGIAYQTLAIISVILFGLYGFLYIARLIMYPKKCLKEWRHPVMGNLFSAITICIILYGLLLFPQDSTGGITLVYIGAVTQMLISVLRVANLIYDWVSEEMVNASLMMTPVANFIGAIGYATYLSYSPYTANNNLNYLSISRLWFGVAALFAVTLFIITFRRALHDAHADVRMRPMLWVWLATFSISGPAFLLSTGTSTILGILAAKGLFYQSMWCISLFFAVVLSLGYIRGFFSYTEDMSMWVIPFAYSAFAINTVQYYRIVNDGESFMYVMSIISLVIASTSTAVTGLTTLQLLFDGTVFKPRPKWGPISFMKLTHECFRFALPKYQKIIESIDVADTLAVQYLIKDLDALFVTFMEHSRHEDEVLFPRLRRFFPGLNPAMDAEHEAAHTAVHKMEEAIHKYRDLIEDQHSTVGAVEMITVLKENFASWVEMVLPHLRNEESTITVAARKYLSLDYQMQISREVFDVTPASGWRLVIPFVVNNLPTAVWKSRYIKTFTWGYPSRAQEIGLMLYHSVDAITWLSIIKELPEIIPRGLPGHKRIY